MQATIMYGKPVAEKIKAAIIKDIEKLKIWNIVPCLAVVVVGEDPASKIYVSKKEKLCNELGIISRTITLPESSTTFEIINEIEKLNRDNTVSGIIVQLPLPKQINKESVIESISKNKDVDGFSYEHCGQLLNKGISSFMPCTPFGIANMLAYYNIECEGKHVVIVGRSNIVGKPFASIALGCNATVTVCHSKTKNLQEFTKQADILVVAIGKAKFITKDMVKPGAVVIDVGINRLYDPLMQKNRLFGDVDFDNVKEIASHITPVPGGVGVMTVTTLMENTVNAAKLQIPIS